MNVPLDGCWEIETFAGSKPASDGKQIRKRNDINLMNQTSQTISVIIAVFNGEKYLAQTLKSILDQDYTPLEVIVINDGSTDKTGEVLSAFNNRIRVIYQENTGVSAARNKGIELAQGEMIVFFDADDLMYPAKLSDQAALLSQQPSLGYVHSGWDKIDANGRYIISVKPWTNAPHLDLKTWVTASPVYLGAMMFRREWVKRTGLFDPELVQSEDVDWLYRLALTGSAGAWLEHSTVGYRQHDSSVTTRIEEAVYYIDLVLERFFSRPDLPPDIQEMAEPIRYNMLLHCAGRLFQAGLTGEIPNYLQRSLSLRQDSLMRTILRWLGYLIQTCRMEKPEEIQQLREVYPSFKAALQVDSVQWDHLVKLMDMILDAEIIKRSRIPNHDGNRSSH